jgi:hypothetical protein
MTGVRFLFRVTLRRHDLAAEVYHLKERQKLPLVMSPEEAKRLLAMSGNLKVHVMLALGYGCGLRAGEIVRLRAGDIDSAQMIIRIVQGKGRKDRHVMLPPEVLALLRQWGGLRAVGRPSDSIHPDRPSDVLEGLLAHIRENEVELPGSIFLNARRDTDAARFGQCFQPCSDIHAITEGIAVFDHNVALMNANAVLDAPVSRDGRIALAHPALHCVGATKCINDTAELDQQSVARRFEEPAVMRGNRRINQVASGCPQCCESAFLVLTHQPRIARHIGGHDRGETADSGHRSPRGSVPKESLPRNCARTHFSVHESSLGTRQLWDQEAVEGLTVR